MSERERELESMCDRLAASVWLLAHDAHPVYANTGGWRGGIGGQAMTQGCSVNDPAPGEEWTQMDLPTSVLREWVRQSEREDRDVDWPGLRDGLKSEWLAMLRPTTTRTTTEARDERGAV